MFGIYNLTIEDTKLEQEIARDSSRNIVVTKVPGISFSDIPGQSALFTTYLSDPSSLRSYFPNAVDDPLDAAQFAPTVIENYRVDRGTLCNTLAALNSDLGSGDRSMSNIELFRGNDVVAVVTGQQCGLFGGPIYTIYKALSAIKLAQELTATGVAAVPVFWMATEDHDFEEVSSAYFFDAGGKVFRSHYEPTTYAVDQPVGQVEIDASISRIIEHLTASLPKTAFASQVLAALKRSWQSGKTFGRAFGESMSSVLSNYGLIMLDPLHPSIKRLAAPIYSAAIDRSEAIISLIRERDEDLKKSGFHSQVLVDENYFPLFWHDESGARTALKKTSADTYRAKGHTIEFSRGQLLSLSESHPERFSPGVMLRPAVQDYLLPTVAYFGGGAEIAYFAQNSVVYEALNRPVTPIFHRQSFTVLEPKAAKTMRKLGLEYDDLMKKPEAVAMRWATANIDPETTALFSTAEEAINKELFRLDEHLGKIDPTLSANLAKRRRKMAYHIDAIRSKTLRALSRRNGDAERRINDLFDSLMPNGVLQERSINVHSYLNKYGPRFIDWVYDAVDLTDKRHRLLEIPNE